MAPRLRALVALAEDLGRVLTPHGGSEPSVTTTTEDLYVSFFWTTQVLHAHGTHNTSKKILIK